MKISTVKVFIISILCLNIVSCGQEEEYSKADGIIGEWIWVESVGGFAGTTITPDNDNMSLTLIISDLLYQEFVNDSLVFETAYELETSEESLLGTTERILIKFESGKTQAVVIKENNLEFIDQIFDGFTYKYRRN